MTQAPTPGPLDKEDWGAITAHPCYGEHQPGCDCVIPDQSQIQQQGQWMERKDGAWVATDTVDLTDLRRMPYKVKSWVLVPVVPTEAMLHAVRPINGARVWSDMLKLAPTAPVEASGSEREIDAFESLAVLRAFPSNQGEVEGRITEKGSRMIDACCSAIESALRPQPSGETREQVARLDVERIVSQACSAYLSANNTGSVKTRPDRRAAAVNDGTDAILALRPAPVASGRSYTLAKARANMVQSDGTPCFASGGQHSTPTDFPPDEVLACVESQHSSGEGVPEWRSGEGAPVYPKGTVVAYRGRHFRALRDVKASAKTNAPNYSGFWEEVK